MPQIVIFHHLSYSNRKVLCDLLWFGWVRLRADGDAIARVCTAWIPRMVIGQISIDYAVCPGSGVGEERWCVEGGLLNWGY